uniref:GTP-binding protein n=2 Tax=Timema TaxID=61471 RepID=A0A7R9HQR0_9NEOP|nr:unnamed protein product [Timema monikensis]
MLNVPIQKFQSSEEDDSCEIGQVLETSYGFHGSHSAACRVARHWKPVQHQPIDWQVWQTLAVHSDGGLAKPYLAEGGQEGYIHRKCTHIFGEGAWKTNLSIADRDSILDLPVIGSLVYCKKDAYQQQAVIDGEASQLDILDTAGQEGEGVESPVGRAEQQQVGDCEEGLGTTDVERFHQDIAVMLDSEGPDTHTSHRIVEFTAMRDQYMRCGEGFMICYSVTDRHSFQEAVEYRKLINKVRASEDIPLVLIGNKFDLQQQRKVTPEEGRALATQFGCPFYETSAALRHYVDDAFHTLVREIRLKERERHQTANKLHKHSRWRRLRSIFAVVFKRRRTNYSP